jgi:hypothetical protein
LSPFDKLRAQDSKLRAQDSKLRAQDPKLRAQDSKLRRSTLDHLVIILRSSDND